MLSRPRAASDTLRAAKMVNRLSQALHYYCTYGEILLQQEAAPHRATSRCARVLALPIISIGGMCLVVISPPSMSALL